MPTLNWYNPFGSFIDKPEQMKTVADFPLVIIDLLESKRLSSEDLGDVNEIAVPLDLTVVSHLPNDHSRVIFHWRDLGGIATWRGTINAARSFSSQGLMGTLRVILLLEQIKMLLLALMRWLRWGRRA